MITHEIRNPIKQTQNVFQQAKNTVLRLIGNDRPSDRMYSNGVQYMNKHGYAMWLETTVMPNFKKGSLRTLRAIAFVPGQIPSPLFKVTDIQEIHWMAPLDEVHKEPRCIQVVMESINVPTTYSPKMLRPLTEEELNLVRIRDSESKDATLGTNPQGEFVLVDNKSGKVIKTY